MTKKLSEKPEDAYRKALIARFKELKTKHSFEEAEEAASRLQKILKKKEPSIADSIGISLLEDKSDFRLTLLMSEPIALENLPSNIDDIEIKAIYIGKVTSGLDPENTPSDLDPEVDETESDQTEG